MVRTPCCDKDKVKKGAWSVEEDKILVDYIQKHGLGSWRSLPKNAGLLRCGKSCRLRWTNYLRPDIKRGDFAPDEEATIIRLHSLLGNNLEVFGTFSLNPWWAAIASHLPGRTDNEIKNFWNTRLKKRQGQAAMMSQVLQINKSCSSTKLINVKSESPESSHMVQWENARVEAEARFSMESLLHKQSSAVKTGNGYQDYHLRLWNSEVGESFRKVIKDKVGEIDQSSMSHMSSATNSGSSSVSNTIKAEDCKPDLTVMAMSSSISSNEFSDSSDTALRQLLDMSGGNDMEFIQKETENFSDFLDLRSN